jgi:hypothetical protein
VYHHGSSDAHDGLYGTFCYAVVVVGTNSSKLYGLRKLELVFSEVMRHESAAIVSVVSLWDHSNLLAH